MNKKLLYMFDAADWISRIAVAREAQNRGYEVVIGLINADETELPQEDGLTMIALPKPQGKLGVLSALKMVAQMRKKIREQKPDLVHVVTLKYSFMSGLADFFSHSCKKIYTLAGLGYVFRGESFKSKLLRVLLTPYLVLVLRRRNTHLIFQNADDLDLMLKGGYATISRSVLIKGSGVYLDRFTPKATPSFFAEPPVVLMPTRLVHEKGVRIFIEAAKLLENQGVEALFQIAGGITEHNPRAITQVEMEEMLTGSKVDWLGRVTDIPERLSDATLVVYPSYYGEGIPRVLLEACAAGRAIVTTDHPGCKEAVDHKFNGLLVPVKDIEATAQAIKSILEDHETRHYMEVKSRKKAEKEFDIHTIVSKTVDLYGRI